MRELRESVIQLALEHVQFDTSSGVCGGCAPSENRDAGNDDEVFSPRVPVDTTDALQVASPVVGASARFAGDKYGDNHDASVSEVQGASGGATRCSNSWDGIRGASAVMVGAEVTKSGIWNADRGKLDEELLELVGAGGVAGEWGTPQEEGDGAADDEFGDMLVDA
jgi:hypothetical protein